MEGKKSKSVRFLEFMSGVVGQWLKPMVLGLNPQTTEIISDHTIVFPSILRKFHYSDFRDKRNI